MKLEDYLNCVGKGWAELVTKCYNVCVKHNVEIAQVKEKFGGLRFYVYDAPEEVHKVIKEAEEESFKTCEICGNPGKIRGGSWILTLCDKCYVH